MFVQIPEHRIAWITVQLSRGTIDVRPKQDYTFKSVYSTSASIEEPYFYDAQEEPIIPSDWLTPNADNE